MTCPAPRRARALELRERWTALVAALGRRDRDFVEQATFLLSFLPALVTGRPDVAYNLGNLCWHWREVSRQRFTLLYYNGGLTTRPFTRGSDALREDYARLLLRAAEIAA